MLVDRENWERRDSRFLSLIGRPKYVGMELVPRLDASWSQLCAAWIALPRHGNLLNALAPTARGVILRFAALDFGRPHLRLDATTQPIAAAFGAQLAGVFELLLERVKGPDRGLFLQPFACIDLDDELRVGFECGAQMRPPEMNLDEHAFIYVIGRLWTTLLDTVPQYGVGRIIRRCTDIEPRKRFASFEKLRDACIDLSAPRGLRSDERLEAWYLIESAPPTPARASYLEGRAHFLARRFHEAQVCFASAILLDPMMLEAQLLRREVDRAIARTRARAGTSNAMPIDVPESLRDVRDIVIAGRIKEAIAVLSTDR